MHRKGSVVYNDYRALEGEFEEATATETAGLRASTQPPERQEHQKQDEEQETTAVQNFSQKTQRKQEKRARKAKIVI